VDQDGAVAVGVAGSEPVAVVAAALVRGALLAAVALLAADCADGVLARGATPAGSIAPSYARGRLPLPFMRRLSTGVVRDVVEI
jgi:hypothetical protein